MSNPPLAAGSRLMVQFRAGKMQLDGKTLKPDTRKGLLRAIRSEDGLVHVEWFERTDAGANPVPEVDVIVFPEEAHFERAGKGPQRVYVLKFASEPDRNLFIWLQEPEEGRDAALVARLDNGINLPLGVDLEEALGELLDDAEAEAEAAGGPGIPASDALERAMTDNAPGAGTELAQGATVGVFGQAPGQAPHIGGSDQRQAAAALAAMLSGMVEAGQARGMQAGANDPGASLAAALAAAMARTQAGGADARRMAVAAGPSLADVLKPEVLAPLLADPEVLDTLAPFLPEQHRTRQALANLAHSPHFQQQLATFGMALQTGQLDMAQFGLRAEGFRVQDFLAAIQELVDREGGRKGGPQPPAGS